LALKGYLAHRAIYTLLVLLIIITFNFILFQVLPFTTACRGMSYNDCITSLYVPPAPSRGGNVTAVIQHERQSVITQFGFDQPVPVRFLLYFYNMLTWQFGFNLGGLLAGPVSQTIAQRAPYTILLLGSSIMASFIIGIGLGVIAAAKRGKVLDIASLSSILFFFAMPVFWLGGLLIILQIILTGNAYVSVGSLTLTKTGLDAAIATLQAMFLPFLALTLISIGSVFLTMRSTMIDALAEDYVVMARARGIDERTVLYRHAMRNAILPIITLFALTIGFILTGAVLTETVFDWPGLGRSIFDAVTSNDFPLEQALFYIITVMVLISNFVVDIMYGFLDPRVKAG
jgi:peptide/nickel transport system permease protein